MATVEEKFEILLKELKALNEAFKIADEFGVAFDGHITEGRTHDLKDDLESLAIERARELGALQKGDPAGWLDRLVSESKRPK